MELCLIARSLGAHLASVPFLGSAALRFPLEPFRESPPRLATLATATSVAVALLEPGSQLGHGARQTTLEPNDGSAGRKVAVEQLDVVDRLAVVALDRRQPALAIVPLTRRGSRVSRSRRSTRRCRWARVELTGVVTGPDADRRIRAHAMPRSPGDDRRAARRAEAVGAAGRALEDARRYAGERRQFGRTIGSSYQSLRHLLADMYVRHASAWSTVLYAAAAFDDGVDDAEQTASVAKAYVARGAREVAHGAMQVFGGIAFTEEHQAHRFLRRIFVREQQFGDAVHHERRSDVGLPAPRVARARSALA